jgi:hypothetical protein
MTVHLHLCEWFEATPDQVWADIEHLETHGEWMADAHDLRFVGTQRNGIGTTLENTTRVGPFRTKDTLSVTEWDPCAAMAIEHVGAVRGTGRFTLAPEDTGTRFCWDEVLRFPWWMGGPAGERVAKPLLLRIWRKNLLVLKDRVERG